MNVVSQYKSLGSVDELCRWANLSRSVYYYHPNQGRKGRKPSVNTMKRDGTLVENVQVVKEIRVILGGEFVCYGYRNVRVELQSLGYMINHKKVYRLMEENHLLLGKVIHTSGKRAFVHFRKIETTHPMEYLCWDIKYVWVQADRRNYYLLSLMDVHTRRILEWIFQGSIRKVDLMRMIERVHLTHELKGVILRNDNGSQFIANQVRRHLHEMSIHQEFTHISTPQENSYIEAFHSIFEREVVQRFEFAGYYDAKQTVARYMDYYNSRRRHGSLGRKTPMEKWREYVSSCPSGKPQHQQVEEAMSRVDGTDTKPALDIDDDTVIFAEQMSRILIQNEAISKS